MTRATPAPRPPATRRERRRQGRTDDFLDAAMAIVAREGLEALTVARLAADVDAAVGALYRYFPGKSELVGALQGRALAQLVDEMAAAVLPARAAPLTRVLAVLVPFATLAVRDPPRHRLLDAALSSPDPVLDEDRARAVEAVLRRAFAIVEDALRHAAREGALAGGDERVRTRVLWAVVHGTGHLRKRDRLEDKALAHGVIERAALAAALVGFGATPRAAAAALASAWPRARHSTASKSRAKAVVDDSRSHR